MDRRTLLAVVISISVIVVYQYYMVKRYPDRFARRDVETRTAEPRKAEEVVKPVEAEEEFVPVNEEEFVVETDRLILTFSNIGGSIKKIELKEFADSETDEPFELIDIKDPRFYMGAFNLIDYKELDKSTYDMSKTGDKIRFLYKEGDFEIEKVYQIHNYNDYIELYTILRNNSYREIRTSAGIVVGSNINIADPMAQRYINVSSKVDGRIFNDKRDSSRPGDVSWVSLNSKYFCILSRPYQVARKTLTKRIGRNLSAGMESASFIIPPGTETTQQYLFYIGPLETKRLKALELGLEEAVNYGVFGGISKLLLSTLRLFHKVVRNWGVAIIGLTILVNTMLYPLTRKSYKSMKAMQELQPHIDNLRTMHKDNPQRMNKELMELYRKYNVNPLGGCLPLLLQMPIFIALYHGLVRSIELKGANFLWIKDLSKPDAVGLPFSLPILGNSINILPILMMFAMIFQQKLSSPHRSSGMSEQQKQQQNMMLMMPVIFVIIFYTLPSGLVLYWLCNTVLMMIHQYHIKKAT